MKVTVAGPRDPLRASLPRVLGLRSLVLIGTVLALLAVIIDFAVYGPVTTWAARALVVEPVEKTWGFHAEWRTHGSGARAIELLTVVSVAPGGAFELAGIKPGFAFAPRTCGFGGAVFAGPHTDLARAGQAAQVRMLAAPSSSWETAVFEVRRKAA